MKKLITYNVPKGTITNSNLEFIGTIIEADCMANNFNIRKQTGRLNRNNTPAIFLVKKGLFHYK